MTDSYRGNRRWALGLVGQAGLLLGGCSVLSSEAPVLYVLSPKSSFAADLPQVNLQLVVDEPFAAAGLNSARIALAPDPLHLEYFADVAWSDRAPAMVQTLIVESFENTERIVAVSRDSVDLRPNFLLKTELREFQAELRGDDEPPGVHVQLNAKLVSIPQRLIFANNTFEARAVAGTRELGSVVTAFDEALGTVLKDMVEWTLRTLPAPSEPLFD